MSEPFFLIGCLLLLVSGCVLVLSVYFAIRHEPPKAAQHRGPEQSKRLDLLQSLIFTYGALAPVYLPDLYAHLREQDEPERKSHP